MIKQFVVILILTSSNFVLAQQKIGIDTSILIGNEIKIFTYRKIVIDQNSNKYLLGFFKGPTIIGSTTLNTKISITNNLSESAQGCFIAKYDSNNNFLWSKKLAESDSLFESKLFIDANNRLIISNNFLSKLYFENDSLVTPGGEGIFNLFIYDSNGTYLFKKIVTGNAGIQDISFSSNKTINVVGTFGLNGNLSYKYILGSDTLYAKNGDGFITKLDTNFNFAWAKSFGGYGIDGVSHLSQNNESFYLLGTLGTSLNNNICGLVVNFSISPLYTSKWFIAKLDCNGNGIWVQKFGTSESLQFVRGSGLATYSNRVYFSGYSFSNTQNVFLFDGGPTLTGTDQVDYFIAAYDTNGHFKWNTISQSPGNEFISALATDSMCNLYGVGAIDYTTKFSTDTLHTYGATDVMVCSYDSNGNYKWAFNAGGWGTDIGSAITPDNQGNMYIAGGTTSAVCYMGNDTLYPNPSLSTFFFARLDSIPFTAPLGMESTYHNLQNMHVFPNPSNGIYTIQFDQTNSAKGTVTVLNALGQQVFQTNIPAHAQWFNLNTSYLSNGIYLLQYRTEQKAYSVKLIIQK